MTDFIRPPRPYLPFHVTLVVGANCKDGVIILSDRRTKYPYRKGIEHRERKVCPTGDFAVWGAAGDLEILTKRVAPRIEKEMADGIIGSTDAMRFVARIAQVLREENAIGMAQAATRWAELLVAVSLPEPHGGSLFSISAEGRPDAVLGWAALGSGRNGFCDQASRTWKDEWTMREFAALGHSVILEMERDGAESDVGLGGQIPLAYLIPRGDHPIEAGPEFFQSPP